MPFGFFPCCCPQECLDTIACGEPWTDTFDRSQVGPCWYDTPSGILNWEIVDGRLQHIMPIGLSDLDIVTAYSLPAHAILVSCMMRSSQNGDQLSLLLYNNFIGATLHIGSAGTGRITIGNSPTYVASYEGLSIEPDTDYILSVAVEPIPGGPFGAVGRRVTAYLDGEYKLGWTYRSGSLSGGQHGLHIAAANTGQACFDNFSATLLYSASNPTCPIVATTSWPAEDVDQVEVVVNLANNPDDLQGTWTLSRVPVSLAPSSFGLPSSVNKVTRQFELTAGLPAGMSKLVFGVIEPTSANLAAASRPALRLVIDPTPTSTPYAFEMGTSGVDFSQPLAMWRYSDLEPGITANPLA
jgi:hypothetical protein